MGANHTLTVQPTAQHNTHPIGGVSSAASAVSTAILLLGRFLFAVIFLLSAPMHFSQADIAEGAAHGVPAAALLVPLSGLLAAAGALSIFWLTNRASAPGCWCSFWCRSHSSCTIFGPCRTHPWPPCN